MKPGSLVECVKDIPKLPPFIKCSRLSPKKGDIEEVENVHEDGALQLVGFEFKTLDPNISIVCVGFDPKYWREVQPKADLSFIRELEYEMVTT